MTQGRHFLQIPGPSPVPDRVLRAMDMPVIDHRSSQFAELAKTVFEGCQKIFQTAGPVIIFPSSGTGAWEAAIVNTLSPGDKVLMVETGHFATLWRQMAARWGIEVDFVPGDWRHGADPADIEARLAQDSAHAIQARYGTRREVMNCDGGTAIPSAIAPVMPNASKVAIHAILFFTDAPPIQRGTYVSDTQNRITGFTQPTQNKRSMAAAQEKTSGSRIQISVIPLPR